MSLGYAEKLSYREDLGGQLGAPEIFDQDEALIANAQQLSDMVSTDCDLRDAVQVSNECSPPKVTASLCADSRQQGSGGLHWGRDLHSLWHPRLQVLFTTQPPLSLWIPRGQACIFWLPLALQMLLRGFPSS